MAHTHGPSCAHGTHASHHDHEHAHTPKNFGWVFALGITLNILFVGIEAGAGWWANSMALLADAGHNLSDVLGMLVAWVAFWLATRKPSTHFTYGLGNSSILAALFNAVFLLVAVGMMVWEAIHRLNNPHPIEGGVVMAVACVGILINGLTAWLFSRGTHDLNVRGAYLHMLADAGVSAGVVGAGAIIMATGWLWIDPLTSLLIAGVIVWGTWSLLADALRLSLNGVPKGINPTEVLQTLKTMEGVGHVHDLHIWALSTSNTALTCHLVMPGGHPGDDFLLHLARTMQEKFSIGHVTFQIEVSEEAACLPEASCDAPSV